MTERSARDELLFQFFAGYFHQDWDVDASSWEEVVAMFVRVSSAEEARALREALVAWLEEAVRVGRGTLPAAFGCYYDPAADGLTEREWVERIVGELSREVAP